MYTHVCIYIYIYVFLVRSNANQYHSYYYYHYHHYYYYYYYRLGPCGGEGRASPVFGQVAILPIVVAVLVFAPCLICYNMTYTHTTTL